MRCARVLAVILGLVPAGAGAEGLLALPAPGPGAPAVVTDVVWPALRGLTPGGAWRARIVEGTDGAVDPAELAVALGADGVLWATVEDGEPVLHLYRAAGGRLLDAPLRLPPGAGPESAREAVRLRAAFLLDAPPEAGRPWRGGDRAPPAGPPLPPLPPARRADLITPPPPPPPARPDTRPPEPPPPLPALPPPPGPQIEITAAPGARPPEVLFSTTAETAERAEGGPAAAPPAPDAGAALRLSLGPAVLADADHAEAGVTAGVEAVPAGRWGARLGLGAFPLRTAGAGDAAIRATTVRLSLAVVRVQAAGPYRFAVHAGPAAELLHADGEAVRMAQGERLAFEVGARFGRALSPGVELVAAGTATGSPWTLSAASGAGRVRQARLQGTLGLHLVVVLGRTPP